MSGVTPVHHMGSNNVQVEVVTSDGYSVTTHPIRIEELLQQQDHTLDVGGGIALRLEELNAEQDYSDDSDDNSDTSSSSSSNGNEAVAEAHRGEGHLSAKDKIRAAAPPGTHATNDWYDVLDALRREQQDVERTTAAVESLHRSPQEGEGRLITRNPNDMRSVSTPLKRFSNLPSAATRSIAGDRSASPPPPPGASRHAVWASLAPPKDTQPRNFNVLRYVSFMSALDYRRFRPTALAFHAAAAYLSRKDRGQRFLVYGGLAVGARKVEQELYEFSVLTGNWRRVEGRQLVPAGHYGHTMTVVESLDRLVVIGGIGPGGGAVSKEVKAAWAADPLRAPRYDFLCPLLRRGGLLGGASGSGVAAATHGPASPLGIGAAARRPTAASTATIGFVPLLFDMDLGDLAWRAIQPAQPFPLAYHTALHVNEEIYVFGGLTEELRVSGQLLAINPETYAVRLIAPTRHGTAASSRSRHTRSESAKTSTEDEAATAATTTATAPTEDDEAAGPGPRFLHTAVRYGPYMIVFGGYNIHNEAQSDCWAFDCVNERWERLRCRGEIAGRAGHECCVVGCRMIVTGGFECSLEEAGATAAPAATVMELNLVPTTQGEHLWRAAVKLHPALPPLAFTRCAPCGDDHSFVLFGGLTLLPRRSRSKSAGRRGGSAKRRASDEDSAGDSDDERGDAPQPRVQDATRGTQVGHTGLLRRFTPLDDGLVFTFPVRHQRSHHSKDAPVVNALGVEVDPNELPEHFKVFVRRQEDFIKKKDAAAVDVMRKTTLEEQEGMEPTLYLTDAEIDLLLQKSEECCVAFAQRYPMTSLPSNVPDREERVRLVEECVSESRQVRDVLKSMKGSAPGVTAVKSKSHRKRAGQKFEDYSAAKPFRRVVVAHLVEGINAHLAEMHRLNKALRTVDWEEKASFLEAVDDMQGSVHAVSRAINGVLRRYVQHSVDSLMKGAEKHKEVMRLLTQVVEKNRHDKIWGVEAARDAQRHHGARAKSAASKDRARSRPRGSSTAAKAKGSDTAAATTAAHSPAPRRDRSLGGGYHADESKAVVHLAEKEWTELLARTKAVEKCAAQLQQYCRDEVSATAAVGPASTPAIAGGGTGAVPLPLPPPGAPLSVASPLPPPLSVPQPGAPVATGLPLPTPSAPSPFIPAPGEEVPLPPPAVAVAPPAEAGAARPRDIVIRHSNELRDKTAAVAEEVSAAAATFYATLTQNTGEGTTAPMSSSSSSSVSSAHAGAAAVPASDALPTPQLAVASGKDGAGTSSQGSSRSSSSSASSSSSSSVAAPAAAPAPLPAVPPLGLPQPATASLPPPGTTAPPPPAPNMSPPHEDSAGAVQPSTKEKKTAATTAAAPAGHAMYLSSLRPLLSAKDTLRGMQGSVSLIRLNEWDGNDLAGAPQDARVEELYKRLDKLLTAVAQSVTSSFLSKAGARPPRVRPAPTVAVAGGPPRAASRSAKSRTTSRRRDAAEAHPVPHASPPRPQSSSSHRQEGVAEAGVQPAVARQTRQEATPGETLRLRPLTSSACEEDWWKDARRGTSTAAAAEAAAPLVPTEALLRDVRLESAPPSAAAATVTIQPVFHDVRTVPNTKSSAVVRVDGPPANCLSAGSGGPWSPVAVGSHAPHSSGYAFANAGGQGQPAMVSLSVAPKVVMPSSSVSSPGDEGHRRSDRDGAMSPSSPQQQQRRASTIEELTQLSPSPSPVGAGIGGGGGAASGGLVAESGIAARAPITSITGGNFVVNTEYLYRVAPQTMPQSSTARGQVPDAFDDGAARHAWADVDDDYFYFGRPAEGRAAAGDAVVSGPPYVSATQTRTMGRVGLSPPVGTIVSSQRLNAELASAGQPSTSRRSLSGRRGVEGGYRTTTASQSQKTQTARAVRKEGENAKRFYTPGELQLMQARERLRLKPQKQ